MERRHKELSELHDFIEGADNEIKIVLEDLKWDKKRFLEDVPKVNCSFEKSHKISPDKMECHEKKCYLKSHGYDKDILLPDPLDADANTLIKLDKQAIITIINNATCGNPLFKQGNRSQSPEPWTLERLQATYTMDERRAIHDAVVQAVPSCHDLTDLALPSNGDGAKEQRVKSRAEILAELRNMKRRRAKYRVAAKTRKYSDILRDVIRTQMEIYTDGTQQSTTDQCRDDYENGIPPQQTESSLGHNGRQKSQVQNPSTFNRRSRNIERSTPAEKVRSISRDRRGRLPRDSYSKNKNRTMTEKRVRNRGEYSTSRYESRRAENRKSVKEKYRSEDAREYRRQHEYAGTSRRDDHYDKHTRQSRKNYASHDSYKTRHRKRHGKNDTSSERDENPSKRRHKEIRHRDSHKASRERHAEKESKVRIKLERDRSADRDLSDNETRYDYVYTSWNRNKHKRSKRDRRSRERYYYKKDRYEDDISIKQERETSESNEVDSQSSYTRTSTYISTRHHDCTSSSESDGTISRGDRRTRDEAHYERTNVRIKRERSDTPDEYDSRSASKRNRKHRRGYHSSVESDSSSRSTESESRYSDRYKNYRNDWIKETCKRIKKEKDATPPKDGGQEKTCHGYQGSKNITRKRSDSNSSWE